MTKLIHKLTGFKRIIAFIPIWAMIILGVTLRAYKADIYPVDNNDDGLFYAWSGITFWDNPRQLMGHSIFDNNNPALIWRSQFKDFIPVERFGMKIVRPWLDHPPLGAAIIGLPAKLLGYRGFEPIPQIIVRWPALMASILTLWLIYLLGRRLFGESVGRWSLLFLATVPYYATAQRQSFLENIMTPIILASLWLVLKNKPVWAAGLALICGWIKVPGFALPFMIAVWLWNKKNHYWRLFLATGIVSIIFYWTYGYWVDKDAWLFILANQGSRGAFVNVFFDAITMPKFYGEFKDGWYILGYIFSFWLMTKKQSQFKFYQWFYAGWLLVIFLTAGRFNNSPWYRYPLIPFQALAIGYYINQLLKKNNLGYVLPIWLLGWTGFDLLQIDIPSTYLRITTIIFFMPFCLQLKKINYWLTRIFLACIIILNIWVILRFPTIHCQQEQCLQPTKIIFNYE